LRPELRQRIFAMAAELGYRGPDPLAAGLRRRPRGPIGVIYANPLAYAFDDPNTNALLGGLSSRTQAVGRGLLLLPGSTGTAERSTAIEEAIVDGIVASSLAEDDTLLETVIERHLPLVVVDQPRPAYLAARGAAEVPWVGIDDRTAADGLADHVFGLGHRRVGVVSFALRAGRTEPFANLDDQQSATLAVTRDRLSGYRAAAARHGIDWTRVPVTQGTDSTAEEGYRGAMAILDGRGERPTALICLSDRLAEGALAAARARGLDVPRDLTVVGFDDAPRLAEALGLTTVAQPSRDKGERAAAALIAVLDGVEVPLRTTLPTRLVVRASSARPR
jgi:DNA-binding LacI/PurR family transcriptional regulator